MKSILMFVTGVLLAACAGNAHPVEVAPGVMQLGTFQSSDINESSGVIASRRLRGAFWTHNDDGDAVLYAFTTNGTVLSQWTIEGLKVHDWEDIAWAAGRIYIADIGNSHGEPGDVYLVAEPSPRKSGTLRVLRRWKLEYPGDAFNSESFFVSRRHGYLVEKEGGKAH